ncbi:hypothetical protein [Neptuniibacter sp. QD37_11]|uniref:hypothetical protein n=1 Tax=Neptuniibacter sp. QD37_11 TaxID=3398209 RepID=UPI0039F5F828
MLTDIMDIFAQTLQEPVYLVLYGMIAFLLALVIFERWLAKKGAKQNIKSLMRSQNPDGPSEARDYLLPEPIIKPLMQGFAHQDFSLTHYHRKPFKVKNESFIRMIASGFTLCLLSPATIMVFSIMTAGLGIAISAGAFKPALLISFYIFDILYDKSPATLSLITIIAFMGLCGMVSGIKNLAMSAQCKQGKPHGVRKNEINKHFNIREPEYKATVSGLCKELSVSERVLSQLKQSLYYTISPSYRSAIRRLEYYQSKGTGIKSWFADWKNSAGKTSAMLIAMGIMSAGMYANFGLFIHVNHIITGYHQYTPTKLNLTEELAAALTQPHFINTNNFIAGNKLINEIDDTFIAHPHNHAELIQYEYHDASWGGQADYDRDQHDQPNARLNVRVGGKFKSFEKLERTVGHERLVLFVAQHEFAHVSELGMKHSVNFRYGPANAITKEDSFLKPLNFYKEADEDSTLLWPYPLGESFADLYGLTAVLNEYQISKEDLLNNYFRPLKDARNENWYASTTHQTGPFLEWVMAYLESEFDTFTSQAVSKQLQVTQSLVHCFYLDLECQVSFPPKDQHYSTWRDQVRKVRSGYNLETFDDLATYWNLLKNGLGDRMLDAYGLQVPKQQ